MSFTFDQRKRPREQTKAEAGRTAEPGPSLNVMTAGQAAAPAGKGSSNLEAVMQERMRNTFGDLGAVREAMNGPPKASAVRETAPAAPYAGSVSHAMSAAAPSASAAGLMQAKRGGKKQDNVLRANPIEYDDVPMDTDFDTGADNPEEPAIFAENHPDVHPIEYEDVLLDTGDGNYSYGSPTLEAPKKKKKWYQFWK